MPAKCKQREQLLASDVMDVPALPVGAVRGILCFRCFEPAAKILKCAACRRTGYCSKECQKLDWNVAHKKQCKILKQVNEMDLGDYREKRTWDEYRATQVNWICGGGGGRCRLMKVVVEICEADSWASGD